MKRFFALLLTILLIFTCAACTKEEPIENDPSFKVSVGKHSASTYLLDSWREDKEDGTRDYYVSLYLYSETYYSILDESCVYYLNSNEYKPVIVVVDNASVTIINHNSDNKGTSAFAIIKTNKMIDTKKIYVLMDGPVEYDATIKTKEDFKNKYGEMPTKEQWVTTLASYSEQTPPIKTKKVSSTDYKNGLVAFYEETNHYFSYKQNGTLVVDNDKAYIQLDITRITSTNDEMIKTLFGAQLASATVKDDGQIEIKPTNATLETYCEIQDSKLFIGYKTKDSSNINKVISNIDRYIVFETTLGQYIIFDFLGK